jgi:uncharacterized protein YdaU (DUF1376 family)
MDDVTTPMHHYPWHPGDYQLATNHWSELRVKVECEVGLLHDLAYRRLIDLYYGLGGPIPDKTQWVATRVRMLAHVEIVGLVLKEKFTREPGFWRNDKCDKEIARYRKRVVANQKNGKLGGRKPTGNPPANPLGSKPRTKNHKPNTPLPPEAGGSWEVFWNEHPRKVGKPTAQKAFAAALARGAKPEDILVGMKKHMPVWNAKKAAGEGEKIPHPSTWLNRDGWNDEVMPEGGGPGDGDKAGWWQGGPKHWLDKGLELGLPAPPQPVADHPMEFRRFRADVIVAAGDGPWWDDKDSAYPLAVRLRAGG